jgi:hypothetical protein
MILVRKSDRAEPPAAPDKCATPLAESNTRIRTPLRYSCPVVGDAARTDGKFTSPHSSFPGVQILSRFISSWFVASKFPPFSTRNAKWRVRSRQRARFRLS